MSSDLPSPLHTLPPHTHPHTRDATAEEHQAAAVIQRCMRSHSHHRLQRVTVPGSSEHQEAVRELTESIALLQQHTETLGVAVFR